jgi:hypothetical protein
VKPKGGVFCYLITEARETTALEMPDHENTFVLRVSRHIILILGTDVDFGRYKPGGDRVHVCVIACNVTARNHFQI